MGYLNKSVKSLAVIGACAGLLAACGDNPLASLTRSERVELLRNANHAASKGDFMGTGYYTVCLKGLEPANISCAEVYKGMIAYLKPKIGRVSVSDLTDKDVVGQDIDLVWKYTAYYKRQVPKDL